MLYVVGLGLSDETDITVKGLEAVKNSERIYLEAYTSILTVGKEKLVKGKEGTFMMHGLMAGLGL
jgi:diphthine synthase